MAKLFLYENSDASVSIEGAPSGPNWLGDALVIQRGGTTASYPLAPRPSIPMSALATFGGDWRLAPQPGMALAISAAFREASAGPLDFLGLKFSSAVGYSAELRLTIVGHNASHFGTELTLHVCGHMELTVDGGGSVAAGAAICVDLWFSDLPILPSTALPRLRLRMPDLGFEWPYFDWVWPAGSSGLPSLPPLPWNMGWPALETVALPFQITWRRVALFEKDPNNNDHTLVLEVVGLRIQGPIGRAIEATLHLEWANGDITTGSYIELGAESKTRLQIKYWYQSDDCVAVAWTGRQLEEWLTLFLPEALVPDLKDDAEIALRVLRQNGELAEVRLDYRPTGSASEWTITLPGFAVDVPQPKHWSMVVWRADDQWYTGLFSTFAGNEIVTAYTTFALTNDDDRRLHGDDDKASSRLLELSASILPPDDPPSGSLVAFLPMADDDEDGPTDARDDQGWTTLALTTMGLEDGKPRFLRKTRYPLPPLDFTDNSTLCAPISDLERITAKDVTATIKINPSKLPFFKRDGFEAWKQYLEIDAKPAVIDWSLPGFKVPLKLMLHLGAMTGAGKFDLEADGTLNFDWERFAFSADGLETISLNLPEPRELDFLGLNWHFAGNADNKLFDLVLAGENFLLKQAEGSRIEALFTRLTSPSEPLVFAVSGFSIGPGGVSLDASMKKCSALLNGVATRFEFSSASFQVRDNRTTGFTVTGAGQLPPDLVGEATAHIALQFGQGAGGNLELISATAQLKGKNLLRCQGTRFEFSIDGIGLRFVNDHGDYHLYFTLTGVARFVLLEGDDAEGPLAWLPKIEMQFLDCPLAGDARVLRNHIKFHVEMPKKAKFSFLGCFEFELRGLGFDPGSEHWDDRPAAMLLCGQIKFAVDGGDVVDARFDFHNLLVALPEPGGFFPRLRCRNLGVKMRAGEAFELEGLIDFLEGDEIEPGWRARGFRGMGAVTMMGLPKISATFAFLRVLRPEPYRWERAWFLYAEARHLSIQIPAPIPIYIREVGLGFGYRYTLAMIKAADETNDIKQLIRELDKLAGSQGNLSNVAAWRLDIEEPEEKPRWTIAMRAMLSTASAAASVTDWKESAERTLANVFLMDAVMALRTDFTFFLTARGWLFTNYYDFDKDTNGVRNRPLVAGYALFQPRKHRLLAHAASQPDPAFGDHPPVWDFVKAALRASHYSATLLIEPNLFHMELGWPNVLRWGMDIGPLKIECRGGSITRITPHEMVQGFSFEGRGSLQISAGFDAGAIGASLTATARVAFGARYIAVLGFDRLDRSAFYGAVGLEIYVLVAISVWIRIKIGFCRITLNFGFSFEIGFTALLEVGATLDAIPGCRGTATLSIGLMGRSLRFNVHVGIAEGTVNRAAAIAKPFLNIGLEATEVEPLPGESRTVMTPAIRSSERFMHLSSETVANETPQFALPDYDILTTPVEPKNGDPFCLVMLVPSAKWLEVPPGLSLKTLGFLPVPPTDLPTDGFIDFVWEPSAAIASMIERFDFETSSWVPVQQGVFNWAIKWDAVVGTNDRPKSGEESSDPTFRDMMEAAFIPETLGETEPFRDPDHLDALLGDVLNDPRVGDSSDAAYEAGVRGTVEQFEGSPYLKHDPYVEYEQQLLNGFSDQTTLYDASGRLPDEDQTQTDAMLAQKQAHELRSTIINGLLEDAKAYAALLARNAPAAELQEFQKKSVAFLCGLVFRYNGATPPWMEKTPDIDAGEIWQRDSQSATTPNRARTHYVRAYNTIDTSFLAHPPTFDAIRQVASSSTVAINWEIKWPRTTRTPDQPEHHLRYYHVVRRPLGTTGSDQHFYVKRTAIHYRKDDNLVVLPARFQFVDNFREEPVEDREFFSGPRRYLYTITPVDLAGQRSQRSLSIVAERRPQMPPQAPEDPDIEIKYNVAAGDFSPVANDTPLADRLMKPQSVVISALKPALADAGDDPAPEQWRLVLRRERTLPIGSYPADAASENPRQSAPASNARVLPGDILIVLGSAEDSTSIEKTASGDHTERERQQWATSATGAALLAALASKGVVPSSTAAADSWRPAAWRVFLQTVSRDEVPSTLTPVKLRIEFTLDRRIEERRPELLEWILRPSAPFISDPTEGEANAAPASVPRPYAAGNGPIVFDLQKPNLRDQSIRFLAHPKQWRAARLGWNVTPSDAEHWQRDLLSAFRLYEFDTDDNTAEALDQKELNIEGFIALTRQIRELRLLPSDQLPLSPHENLSPDQWEAWYPSSARRLRLREQDESAIATGRGTDTWLSNWFSWRDSYLDWPALPSGWEEMRSTGDEPATLAETATVIIDAEALTLKFDAPPKGWSSAQREERQARLNRLGRCAALEISGFAAPTHNGIKWLTSSDVTSDTPTFRFELKAFPNPPSAAGQVDVVLSQPRAKLHWLLEQLIKDVENRASASADLSAETARLYGFASDPTLLPPGKATDLEALQDETAPGSDPYGWNALKRMGLSAAVTFRSIRDGKALLADRAWSLLHEVLQEYQGTVGDTWFKYLHVELLFQSGRSIRLSSDPDAKPTEDDLLALVQFSLRPAIVPVMEYKTCVLKAKKPESAPPSITISIASPTAPPSDWQVDLILPGQASIGLSFSEGASAAQSATVSTGASGRVVLLIRTTAATEPVVSVTESSGVPYEEPRFEPIGLNDERLRLFPDIKDRWIIPTILSNDGREFGDEPAEGPRRHWWRLDRYLRLAGAKSPVNEDWVETLNADKTLNWLRRFFNFSGDFDFSSGNNAPWTYGAGPWLATAYPHANTVGFAASRKGRTELYHIIDDGWAHAFRYFVQPLSRYDQLWLGLAQSTVLFPHAKDREANVTALLGLKEPVVLGEGGLDVAVPRIRRVSPPLVLSSRRLDAPTPDGATNPSPVWEVVLAKHPEQTLIDRNRTLAQRLEFQHIAYALVRRFAYIREIDAFFGSQFESEHDVLTSWDDIELVENTYLSRDDPATQHPDVRLPGPISELDWIEIPTDPASVTDAQRTLLLTDRHDTFEHDKVALQWKNLPFFYEHRALFIAAASAVSSPAVAADHSEFEFHSPEPVVIKDAFIDEIDGEPQMAFDLRLNSFWESLPAQNRWDIENPKSEDLGGRPFRPKLSVLPDVGVTYEIVHDGGPAAGVVDSVAAIAFTRSEAGYAWTVRSLSPRFDTKLRETITAPAAGPQAAEHRYLLRVQMRTLLTHPAIEAAVRDRYDFDESDSSVFNAALVILPPAGFNLVLNGPLTQEEGDHLLKLAGECDPHLGAALRALVASAPDDADPQTVTQVMASAGLEQIPQVCRFADGPDRLTLDATTRTLTWRGYFQATEVMKLIEWKASTPFHSTVEALLDAATAARSLAFVSATIVVPPDLPTMIHVIKGAPTGDPDEFNYTLDKDAGLFDASAWELLREPPANWPSALRNALVALHTDLDTLTVEIGEPEWKLRPDESQFIAGDLATKLLLGRSILAPNGLLPRRKGDALLAQLATQPVPARAAIQHLYQRSLSVGLAGGTLTLRTRRGSCRLVTAAEEIQPEPLDSP
ncbi:hypothetical protein [Rhizobium leguminosarum]|uniref:Putative integral membrane protein n=1 Tax=Rhizobium leguminosarum TaxID=384 RepID=A0A2Z4YB16_RHILE|nr:hypothetical protein [Rhizobium leguminosarum]AXA37948.1 putative integral membrane protein [Rhizobium leguminosarum]